MSYMHRLLTVFATLLVGSLPTFGQAPIVDRHRSSTDALEELKSTQTLAFPYASLLGTDLDDGSTVQQAQL